MPVVCSVPQGHSSAGVGQLAGGGTTVSNVSGVKTGQAHPDNAGNQDEGIGRGISALGGAGGHCEHTTDHPEAFHATAGYAGVCATPWPVL